MPVTSSSNDSLLSPLHCFTDSSLYPPIFTCFDYPVSSHSFIVLTFTNLLLLPLYIFILWMGFQRWRHLRSVTSGTTSHSDVFTHHLVTVDIISVLGSVLFCCAIYTCSLRMKIFGYYSFTFTYPGQTFFHCLTCVERYLAVVHPVTYRGLRQVGGVRIRNISIGCVLLMCFGSVGLTALYFPSFPVSPFFAIFSFTIFVVLFCSVSVLSVLIRLGLGRVGGGRKQIDQSKKRAFHTIMAITVTLVLRSCGLMFCNIVFDLERGHGKNGCVILMSGVWMCLPSSLVLPLLFLHRAGKLSCSSRNLNNGEALK